MTKKSTALEIRRLAPGDMDAVVALDAPLAGRTRRAYFERRLAVALRQPELHLQFAAVSGKDFLGHALARMLEGEFGHAQPALRLEVISVAPKAQRRGIGRALHQALEEEARKRKLAELRTVAAWRDHELLRFLDVARCCSIAPPGPGPRSSCRSSRRSWCRASGRGCPRATTSTIPRSSPRSAPRSSG